jgi:hypothetical protein
MPWTAVLVNRAGKMLRPSSPLYDIRYLTRVRRRWIRTISTITNNTPAATRIIVGVSMSNSPFFLFEKCLE